MLAYLFWHARPDNISAAQYEKTLLHFGAALADAKVPGLLDNTSYSVGTTPWLGEAGYEDWAWLDGFASLEALNEHAVTGPMKQPHDAIAQMTRHGGFGALYSLVAGEHRPLGDSKVIWLSRPRGIDWRRALRAIVDSADSDVTAWRRLMVLGPAPEFALVGPPALTVTIPEGWKSLEIERHGLPRNH